MGNLISSINVTPDGFCGHTDVIADEEHHQFAIDLLKGADIVLFGRITYQLLESYWPLAAKDRTLPKPMLEFAQLIDKVDKVVASKTLKEIQWKPTTILKEINSDNINDLKQKSNKGILIFGSPGLVSELTKLGLVDEYYFSVQPIISGKGKRLFETLNLKQSHNLCLTDTKQFKSGVVTLCYTKAK
jgi:dihydrofolate reductase